MIKKKTFIFIVILVMLVICFFSCNLISQYVNKNKNIDGYTTLTSLDNTFTINLPNNINYKINTNPTNDFTIDLYSEKDKMFIYATSIEKKREINLYEITADDKTSYFKDKENIREDTGITETTVNGNKAYEYSLIYFDKEYNDDFYCHVVWIETQTNIYILNFEVVNENAEKYKGKFLDIQNSFVIL